MRLLDHALLFHQAVFFEQCHIGISEHLPHDFFGDAGLRHPGQRLQMAVLLIVTAGAPIELERHAADDFDFADVGAGEPAGDHAADVVAGFQQRRLQAMPRGGSGGGDTTRGAAVNNQVKLLLGQRGAGQQ